MNDYQLMNLANDIMAERRAEADRSRLARSAAEVTAHRRSARTHAPRRAGASLSALFHRVAFL